MGKRKKTVCKIIASHAAAGHPPQKKRPRLNVTATEIQSASSSTSSTQLMPQRERSPTPPFKISHNLSQRLGPPRSPEGHSTTRLVSKSPQRSRQNSQKSSSSHSQQSSKSTSQPKLNRRQCSHSPSLSPSQLRRSSAKRHQKQKPQYGLQCNPVIRRGTHRPFGRGRGGIRSNASGPHDKASYIADYIVNDASAFITMKRTCDNLPDEIDERFYRLGAGYGLLKPKAQDVLKVTLVAKSERDHRDEPESSHEKFKIESCRLVSISLRNAAEWLEFIDATRLSLEESGSGAQIEDLGSLCLIWPQLLTFGNFDAPLSGAIGRFLLELRRRCRRFHRCRWDSINDSILDSLMQRDCLGRLLRPLMSAAITETGKVEKDLSSNEAAEDQLSDAKIPVGGHETPSLTSDSLVAEHPALVTKESEFAAPSTSNVSVDEALKHFGDLARLLCTRDASVMDRTLLPMARELAFAGTLNAVQQRRSQLLLLDLMSISSEVQQRQRALVARGFSMSFSLLPSCSELTASGGSDGDSSWLSGLRPAVEKGAYENTDDYIDTMYRLLRADCFDTFRQSMEHVRTGRLVNDAGLRLYLNVKVHSVKVSTRGAALRIAVAFDLPQGDRGPSNWEKSSRLMQGNLLCLSLDEKFAEHFWATVVEKRREELTAKKRVVWIQPCRPDGTGVSVGEALMNMLLNSTDASRGMLMLESPTMFRAFQPVLESLQSLSADDMPFADVLALAHVESASEQPEFVRRYYSCEQSAQIGVNGTKEKLPFIKQPNGLTLDRCQTEAFANALHHKVYVCQGPPGTGKTLLGVLIAKQLLELDTLKGRPLLVLCYKNHALDEFLVKLLPEYGHHMVRIGGRSQDSRLDNIGLVVLRRENKVKRPVRNLLCELQENWQGLKDCLEHIDGLFEKPERAIMNSCNYQQLYSIIHRSRQRLWGEYAQMLNHLKSVPPPELYKEIIQSKLSQTVFDLCVHSFLPNLAESLQSKSPKPWRIRFPKIKNEPTKNQVKEEAEKNPRANENVNENDDSEEVQEREEQLAAASRFDGPNTSSELMQLNLNLLSGSKMYLDSEIKSNSKSNWAQNLLSRFPTYLDPTEQWLFFQLVLDKAMQDAKETVRQHVERITEIEAELEKVNIEADAEILSQKRVIGMTITGASIHKELLDALKPAVVILEEAAEVSEPQLLACLGPHTEQLILIGDHKQLKPQTESYTLAKDYHLDLSMMERLIINGIKFDQLELQNRMRPEFSNLLRDIYPNLRDNHVVVHRQLQPACLVNSMFFWTHTELETEEPGRHGAVNKEEAERCVRLAKFLVEQGCSPDRITILCAYRRQTSLVRRSVHSALAPLCLQHQQQKSEEDSGNRQSEQTMEVKVHTIDLYQGDENDVVIVSLVRSNPSNTIGFLKTMNRRCVAQSRARLAMVFVGNADCIYASKSGTVWRPLIDAMRLQNCLGPAIPLRCPDHPDTIVLASGIDQVPLDSPFCEQICGHLMPCGVHQCTKICQPKHESNHKECKEAVTFRYPECGHEGIRFCYQQVEEVPCTKVVDFVFSDCGHKTEKKCGKPDGYLKCREACNRRLPCGHTCKLKCVDVCSSKQCNEIVPLEYPCKHKINTRCFEDRSSMTCKKICTHFLVCGHPRTHECSSDYWLKPCKATASYTYPDCGHKVSRPCCELKDLEGGLLPQPPCQKKCERHLPMCPFKHSCTATCNVDCSTVKCLVKIKFRMTSCQHEMERECWEPEESVECSNVCGKLLEGCGHYCSQPCSEPCNPGKCETCKIVKYELEKAGKLMALEAIRKAAQSELEKLNATDGILRTAIRTILDRNTDASEFLDVADKVVRFVQPEHGWHPRVTRVEKVSNPFLLRGFFEFKATEAVDPTRVEDKFHGTSAQALECIIKDGFRLPEKKGMYGAGIYFATDSSKSSQRMYTKDSNMLLLCSVVIGRSKTVTQATDNYSSHQQLKSEGFDSLFASRGTKSIGGVLFDEYVVFDVRQALPKYIVHYDNLAAAPRLPTLMSGGSKLVKIKPIRYREHDNPDSWHFSAVQAEYSRVDGTVSRFGQITEVWVNRNPNLEAKFEAKRSEFEAKYGGEASRFVFAFHGTSRANAEAIFRENFRLEKCVRKAYGPGVYFSEFTEESQQYGDALLLCKLLLGKEVDHPAPSDSGHDTIRVGNSGQRYQMLIINNPDQIMPLYRVITDKKFRE